MRILLVEDNVDNRNLIVRFLKKSDVQVDVAENGALGVERFTTGDRYDLVLMDVQMPVMDGYTAARAIRAWERDRGAAQTPIVALTAHTMEGEELAKCRAAGCVGFLTKPIGKAELLQGIETYTTPR